MQEEESIQKYDFLWSGGSRDDFTLLLIIL